MKFAFFTLVCLFCLEAQIATANGNWIGNAGVAVLCENESGQDNPQWTLLDLIEADDDDFIAEYPQGDLMEQVHAFIDRVETKSPERVRLYRLLANEFLDRIVFKAEVGVTSDWQQSQVPASCKATQAIVQYSAISLHENIYYVAEKIWNALDTHTKAVFILHEIFYYEASALGLLADSTPVRKYVRAVVGNKFKSMTQEQYSRFMSSLGLGLEYWKDPVTGKKWGLISPCNSYSDTSERCDVLFGGILPSKSEFLEAAPRLFASREARNLSLLTENLGFWVKGDGHSVDRFGHYIQKPWDAVLTHFCVMEEK